PLRVSHVLTKELVYLPLAFKLRFAFERLPVVPRFRFACADRVTKRLCGKRARRRVLFACRRLRRRSRALQGATWGGPAQKGPRETEKSPPPPSSGRTSGAAGRLSTRQRRSSLVTTP